jgi:hypothetical protein
MLRQVAIFLTALLVLLGAFLLVERTSSPFFQKCISEEGGSKGEQPAKESNSSVSPIITAYVRCSGRFMDGHGVGLTAIASFIIAAFTATLWIATKQQGFVTLESLRLAREEFISTHRPKIIIHTVDVARFANAGNPESIGSGMDKVGAVFLCINKGRTPALNIEVRGATMASQNIPDAKIQRPIIKTVDSLESGIKIWTEIDTGRSFQEMFAFRQPIYFIGTIAYFDKSANRRETGFCYEFIPDRSSWIRTESKAHNYAY